ncbi:MAG: hypothetical protein ACOX6A_06610 [Atribacter sp.]
MTKQYIIQILPNPFFIKGKRILDKYFHPYLLLQTSMNVYPENTEVSNK